MKIPHLQIFLVKNEKELRDLVCGENTRRAAKGDQIVLLESITLTADLNIPCEVTFLLPPGVTLNTQGHALRAKGSESGAAAFRPIPKYLGKMAKKQ